MNEEHRQEENIGFQGSRVSTNDSNEMDDLDQEIDPPSLMNSSRATLFDQENLNFNEESRNQMSIDIFQNDQGFTQNKRHSFYYYLNMMSRIASKCIYYLSMTVYHMFTTLILLTQSILFSTITLLFAFDILSIDSTNLFRPYSQSPDRPQTRRGGQRNRPQSQNHRRIGRDYDRDFYQARVRRIQRQQRQEEQEIQMQNLNSEESQNNEDSNNYISNLFSNENILRRAQVSSRGIHTTHVRDTRMRREMLRNELLRILTSTDLDRARHNSTLLLRNLQMLQLASLGRDFNENDYEMLSSLDQANGNRNLFEKNSIIISQLPTYKFKCKSNSVTPQKTDSDEMNVADLEANSKNHSIPEFANNMDPEHRNFCTICIESFDEDEIIKILPCFHQFHSTCIDDWLLRKSLCPVCKFDVSTNSQDIQGLD